MAVYCVSIIDKNESVGGRLTSFKKEGFTFDLGPTWYWMPDVFDNFFKDFNKNTSDYYKLTRLEPSYKFFANESQYDISTNKNDLEDIEAIEDIEKRLEHKKLFSKILNDISTY